ncbi:MAG: S9 family peptidase [Saprospiraceae bacterium]|nr:S9 family peptidase [Saprospiraceae bacterium]
MKRILFLTLSMTLFILPMLNAQTKRSLQLHDYAKLESVSNPQIAPDGSKIIFTRTWVNLKADKRESDLWIMNADGSQQRFLTQGSNATWSPQSDRIAFTRQGNPEGVQIFIKYVDLPGEATQITRLKNSPSNMEWAPDGRQIAFTSFVDAAPAWKVDLPKAPAGASWTPGPKVVDQLVYRRDRRGYLKPGFDHIFMVDANGGEARQITSGDYDHGGDFAWLPDGQSILFSSLRIPDAEYAYRESQLYQVFVADGTINQITDRKGSEYNPVVSPDGQYIAFIGTEWTKNFYHARNVYLANIDGSGVTCISKGLDRNAADLRWAMDGSGVYYDVPEYGAENLYFSSLEGTFTKVTTGQHRLNTTGMANDGTLTGTLSTSYAPADVIRFTPDGSITQLTTVNEDVLSQVELGEVEDIRYQSTDGTDIQGWLVKPPYFDPDKAYPLILRIHGGPHSMYRVNFNFNFQLHAAEGALVLYTNPRGSTGYGYDFANAIQNAYPGKDYDDLMRGVDEIIARGYVDTNRLYVYGGSGGGVLTSWIVGHTDRFAAASVNYPVTNWFSFVGTTDGVGWYRNFEKYPWEDPSEHLRRSPLMYVGNVKTPTMLMTGVKDLRTPISQTEEYYQALKVQKVPTVMLRFNDEYHGTGSNPSNYLRTFAYLRSWFDQWPKSEP